MVMGVLRRRFCVGMIGGKGIYLFLVGLGYDACAGNFVVLNMVQNVPANNVFKKFTGNTSQRNWSVVFSQNSVAFLENWCNVSQRPV